MGAVGDVSNTSSASLAAGEAHSTPIRFPAPYSIQVVTVTRGGNPLRHEVNLTVEGGRRYELLVNADDTVAVGPAPN